MPVLALDTSAAVTVAVLEDTGALLARRDAPERRRHAESLMPLVQAALAESGTAPGDLDAVAVGTGPAPFTGLRVGLVTARTLAFALDVPVLGVPSLDAVAARAVVELGLTADDEVLAASDARRREVYWGRYRVLVPEGPRGVPVLRAVLGPRVGPVTEAAEHSEGAVAVGEGAVASAEEFASVGDAPTVPDAAVIGRLALARREAGDDQPTEPLYLRRPDVHVSTTRKRVSDGTPFTVEAPR